jgi:hypothetical protein
MKYLKDASETLTKNTQKTPEIIAKHRQHLDKTLANIHV